MYGQPLSEEEYDWLWFCAVPGAAGRYQQKLLEIFGTPRQLRQAILDRSGAFLGLEGKWQSVLSTHQKDFQEKDEYNRYQEKKIGFVSCRHPKYPKPLLSLPDPPAGLFYLGRLPGERERCVAMVGARSCSAYGRNMARQLAGALAECGVSVVSGMAYGIDAHSQDACLEAGGQSYGVLGCGVDICYPQENYRLYQRLSEQGGVLSEFLPGTPPLPHHFPVRNRIISGLCELVIVVEARKRSGTLITADQALEQGRDVYVFPGRVGDGLSEGCNRLIAQGAGIITGIDGFLKERGYASAGQAGSEKMKLTLATPEKLVYSCLDSGSRSLTEIAEASGLPANAVMAALVRLQMKGLVLETAKSNYAKTR